MKSFWKRLLSAALAGAMLLSPAMAIDRNGEAETWFDSVFSMIESFGLKAEDNPYLLQNYINLYLQKHPEELYSVLNDMLSLLDTHSMYLSSAEYSEGFQTLDTYIGIGISMEESDGAVRISEVIEYTGAAEAGLKAGDTIVAVDGKSTTGWTMAEVGGALRGAENSSVRVTVMRDGRTLSVDCMRKAVSNVYVSGRTVSDGVEYIKISSFSSESDFRKFSEIWQGLDEKNTRAVILDLRGNGGGIVSVALRIADMMTPKADQYLAGVHWREDAGGLEAHYSTGGALPLNAIYVLVDGDTASAAELLAGSLKETGTATLVGTQTYGKGEGQYHIEMINGDRLVITTLELELPKSGQYEGKGITPNLVLSNQKVTVDVASLSPLDTSRPICFGEVSENVTALTERLFLFGLMQHPSETFDDATLSGVLAFEESYEMDPTLCATPEMLAALEQAIKYTDGKSFTVDSQLLNVMNLAKTAAKKPQRYTALPDGTWRAD